MQALILVVMYYVLYFVHNILYNAVKCPVCLIVEFMTVVEYSRSSSWHACNSG